MRVLVILGPNLTRIYIYIYIFNIKKKNPNYKYKLFLNSNPKSLTFSLTLSFPLLAALFFSPSLSLTPSLVPCLSTAAPSSASLLSPTHWSLLLVSLTSLQPADAAPPPSPHQTLLHLTRPQLSHLPRSSHTTHIPR